MILFGKCKFDVTISEMLKRESKHQIIDTTRYIVDHKKIEIVGFSLENGLEPRLTHDLRYTGMVSP